MKKFLLVMYALRCLQLCQAQTNFNATIPLLVSDDVQSLQGLNQQYLNTSTGAYQWQRTNSNTNDLAMYIGSIALNPNNLKQVFFSDNSATNKLIVFNRETSTETYTNNNFIGATQGVNTGGALPVIGTENAFGINMMVINGTNNTGYAIGRNKTLYTFGITFPYIITNVGTITDAPGNSVLYANAIGGGLMVNTDNRLTALVNVPQAGGSFKYYFFDIDPATLVAKLILETNFTFGGFQDNTSFIMGAGITNENSTSIYCSLYTGVESIVYKYSPIVNLFGDDPVNGVYVVTNNNAFGEVSGVGKTSIKADLPILDFVWLGTTSSAWATASNWNKNAIPTSTDPVIISSGTTFAPAISNTQTIKSLTINTTAILTTTATLSVTGACANNGTVAGTGMVALSGSTTQTLSGNGYFKKLTVNTGANVVVATGSNLKFQ